MSEIEHLLKQKNERVFIAIHNLGISFKANGYARPPCTVWHGVGTPNLANLAFSIQSLSLFSNLRRTTRHDSSIEQRHVVSSIWLDSTQHPPSNINFMTRAKRSTGECIQSSLTLFQLTLCMPKIVTLLQKSIFDIRFSFLCFHGHWSPSGQRSEWICLASPQVTREENSFFSSHAFRQKIPGILRLRLL